MGGGRGVGKGEGRRGEEGGGSTVLRCMSLHDHDYSDNFACCIELVVCGVYNLSELTIAPAMLTFLCASIHPSKYGNFCHSHNLNLCLL